MQRSRIQRLPDPDVRGGAPAAIEERYNDPSHVAKRRPRSQNSAERENADDDNYNEPSGEFRRTDSSHDEVITNQDEQEQITNTDERTTDSLPEGGGFSDNASDKHEEGNDNEGEGATEDDDVKPAL